MRIVHFEVPADDPSRCMSFYQKVFGQTPTNVVSVDAIDASARGILAAGGTEVVPKMAVPGVGWTAYFKDTEGNTFGVIQFDPAAA
jgi:predicted enzyme related to lactoylglutathione lyase